MSGNILLWAGSVSAAMAVALLRFAWARSRRSVPLNAGAWILLLGGMIAGAQDSGAWGVAVVSLAAMAAALLFLAYAALASPNDTSRSSQRRVHILPDRGEPLRLGQRFLTFLLVVPCALVAALLLGLAGRAVADLGGWQEADSNVLTLFLMPVLWAVFVFLLMIMRRRRTQAMTLLIPAMASGCFLLVAGIS